EYRCEICSRVFERKTSLIGHTTSAHRNMLSTKSVKAKFPCKVCSYRAVSRCALEVHMCTHTGERPHKCTIGECSGSFTSSPALKNHFREVHKLKPFHCSICGEMFDFLCQLTRHKAAHVVMPSQKDTMNVSALAEEKSLNEQPSMNENMDEPT
ncbi:hypothetical protein PENTCL1PPCAC_12497, partial [Pristionchus entomophagus]